jgi:hypothetical protein
MLESHSFYDQQGPSITCIGDIHGKFGDLKKILENVWKENPNQIVYQLGDFGIGFPNHPTPKDFGPNFRYFVGNHDNRKEAKKHVNCIDDFGYVAEHDLYFISGAWSIDYQQRIIGVNLWEDEELGYEQFDQIFQEVSDIKPRIILSHDCPSIVRKEMFGFDRFYETKTGKALNRLFELHQPTYWCFGHYHRGAQNTVNGTHFVCLQELEWCKVPL